MASWTEIASTGVQFRVETAERSRAANIAVSQADTLKRDQQILQARTILNDIQTPELLEVVQDEVWGEGKLSGSLRTDSANILLMSDPFTTMEEHEGGLKLVSSHNSILVSVGFKNDKPQITTRMTWYSIGDKVPDVRKSIGDGAYFSLSPKENHFQSGIPVDDNSYKALCERLFEYNEAMERDNGLPFKVRPWMNEVLEDFPEDFREPEAQMNAEGRRRWVMETRGPIPHIPKFMDRAMTSFFAKHGSW